MDFVAGFLMTVFIPVIWSFGLYFSVYKKQVALGIGLIVGMKAILFVLGLYYFQNIENIVQFIVGTVVGLLLGFSLMASLKFINYRMR